MSAPDFRTMMSLEPHAPDTFVATGPSYPRGGLYAGQIIPHALRAETLTVDPACDDGDTDAGDGCSATCTIEPGSRVWAPPERVRIDVS